MSFDAEKGTYTIREHVFHFKDLVTAKEFEVLKELRVKHDDIERSDKFKEISEREGNNMEKEWFETVINVGLKDQTLDTIKSILSPGEIRKLVAVTYNFLWTFGSTSEARLSVTTSKATK